jgi:ketosteroid isomerase-like protein
VRTVTVRAGALRAFAFGLVFLVGVKGQLAAQDHEETSPAAAVEAREIGFAKTMADRDFEAFMTFLAEEAIFFAGEVPLRGKSAVGRAWAPFFEGPDPPFSWHPDLVEVLDSGDLAMSSGPVRDRSGEVVGRFNSIWRLEPDGQWHVVFDKGCP